MNNATSATAIAGEGVRRRIRVMAPQPVRGVWVALQRQTARERLTGLLAEQLVKPGDLVRGHRVAVLLLGVLARAYLVGEGGQALDHVVADAGVALDEAADAPVVDAEQVVENEHLPVRGRSRADADHRDLHARHDRLGERAWYRLEHDREAAGLLKRQRVVHDLQRAVRGAALRAVAAERRRGLRGQP